MYDRECHSMVVNTLKEDIQIMNQTENIANIEHESLHKTSTVIKMRVVILVCDILSYVIVLNQENIPRK